MIASQPLDAMPNRAVRRRFNYPMKSTLPIARLALLLSALATLPAFADSPEGWPQWRGPQRNGIATATQGLPDQWTDENQPSQLWESEEVPSGHYGGYGSVSVAGGRVFASVVWHREEPTETRVIDSLVLSNLGFRSTNSFSPELVQKMEDDRKNLNPRLRGAKLDEWANQWVDDNLTEEQKLVLGSWVASRFKQGSSAISIADFDKVQSKLNKEFPNQAALEEWVKAQGFEPNVEQRVLAAVPATKKVADDVVICLDAGNGSTVWRFETPGFPSGRGSSSTPAAIDGRVYAALSTHLYCVNADNGELIWKTPLTGRKGPASSPLVYGGVVYLQQNTLVAFDTASGEMLWENKDVNGSNQSPTVWEGGGKPLIVANGSSKVFGVDAKSGETVWSEDGGGDGTPVVSGDYLVVISKSKGRNLNAYKLSESGANLMWSKDFLTRRYSASPIIYEGNVFHLGSDRHMCLALETGEVKWERQTSSNISSPILADGKLFVYENNAGYLSMIKATGDDYQPLGRAKVGALRCTSPAIAGSRMYFRTDTSISAIDLNGGAAAE